MLKILLLLLCIVFSNGAMAAQITMEDRSQGPVIKVTGEIVKGDAEKLKQLMDSAPGSEDIDGGEVILNSPGGNIFEGLHMGNIIFNKGWSTEVGKDAVCMDACAYAFLGGRFLGASRGWGASRSLQAGGELGFNGLPDAQRHVISQLAHDYAAKLDIKDSIINSILHTGQGKVFMINTPARLKALGINLSTPNKVDVDLTPQAAQQACVNLIRQNVKDDTTDDYELNPVAKQITLDQYKKDILACVAEVQKGPIKTVIATALKTGKDVNAIYDDLASLFLVPRLEPKAKVFKVTGLNNVHAYLSRTGYVIANNAGQDSMAAYYVLIPTDLGGAPESGQLKRYGDVIYDLHKPNQALWK